MTCSNNVNALAVLGPNLFAGTTCGVYFTTNNGIGWIPVNNGLTYTGVQSLAVSGTNLFAGTWGNRFYLSTNNGTSWAMVNNANLSDTIVTALAVCGASLIAGTFGDGVWTRPLSEIITAVKANQNNLPTNFSLHQNYPNPFNPSTTINYSVPKASLITIKVFDILGREMATLVNEQKTAGNYSVQFSAKGGSASDGNGGSLASGIYFYRMQAGSFVLTKKPVLLK